MQEVLIIKIKAGTIIKTVVVASITYSMMNAVAKQIIPPLDKLLGKMNDLNERLKDEQSARAED